MPNILPVTDPEFKSLIPPLSKEERTQLEQNILLHRKCHDAIIVWDGIIIDGHNRFEICLEHGVEFEIKEMTFPSRDEAKVWILENQLGRRNLSQGALIEIVLLKEEILREKARKNLTRGGRPKKGAEKGSPETTTQNESTIDVRNELASKTGVSNGNFSYYIEIMKNGSPELLNKVKSGEMKIGTAQRLLRKGILKDMGMSGKLIKGITQHISYVTDETDKAQVRVSLNNLARLMQTFIDMEGDSHESAKN